MVASIPISGRHPRGITPDGAIQAGILLLGALLFWLSDSHPAALPDWAPWEFSPTIYLGTAYALFWFVRGLRRTRAASRPSAWRCLSFLLGLAAIYAVLQTRFEYWSQHMFFLNRAQHVVMHHVGPFLIALGAMGGTIAQGMPQRLRQAVTGRPVLAVLRIIQQPLLAAFLFVGLFYFWLIPPVHFRAMIDPFLYALMNLSMVVDGLLFWSLVLDQRPRPPARISYGARAALAIGVMFPQIALGALIAFAQHDLYPYYNLCGRLFPSISAISDQHFGGLIIWIPPAMMSVVGLLLVLNALRRHEMTLEAPNEQAAALAALATRWTG